MGEGESNINAVFIFDIFELRMGRCAQQPADTCVW